MGKYNLDRLGWKAFQDLCATIMKHVIGATYVPFGQGPDKGRDGFFQGTVKGETFGSTSSLHGKIIFQCKQTSRPESSVTKALKREVPKVSELVRRGELDAYVVFTNHRTSGVIEYQVRTMFEKAGVGTCVILGEDWIESTIDSHQFLRRLVPTLYGIGDLAQILDSRILQQSEARLIELAERAKTFVSTLAYQNALESIVTRGFVILLGPPGAGKSSVAANIGLTGMAEGLYEDVALLQAGPQFQTHWDPHAKHRLYWYDDVFGQTSLDLAQVEGWQYYWSMLNTAVRLRRVSVIFTCRDYIYKQAVAHIKQSAFPILFDSQVVVNVTDLTTEERGQILYNHIKFGDLNNAQKGKVKPFLTRVSRHSQFNPEIARRLGDSMFFRNVVITQSGIDDFLNRSGDYFLNLVENLDSDHQAALVLILLHGNRLSSPIGDETLPASFKSSYSTNVAKIKSSLEYMKDSLVRLDRFSGEAVWRVYHPSMLDALQALLSRSPEKIELFLLGGAVRTILAETTTVEDHEHKVFIPMSAWDSLISILRKTLDEEKKSPPVFSAVAGYLVREATDDLLIYLSKHVNDILEKSTIAQSSNLDYGYWYDLALRLKNLKVLSGQSERDLIEHIEGSAMSMADMHFLDNETVSALLGTKRRDHLIDRLLENSCEALHDGVSGWSDVDDSFVDDLLGSLQVLEDHLAQSDLLTKEVLGELESVREDARALRPGDDAPSDDRTHHTGYTSIQITTDADIFSDVDE